MIQQNEVTLDADDPTLPADVRRAVGQHLEAGYLCLAYELTFADSPTMLLVVFEPGVGAVLCKLGSADTPAIWGRVIPGEDYLLADGPARGNEGARLCHFSGALRDLQPGELETCLGKIREWARRQRDLSRRVSGASRA